MATRRMILEARTSNRVGYPTPADMIWKEDCLAWAEAALRIQISQESVADSLEVCERCLKDFENDRRSYCG